MQVVGADLVLRGLHLLPGLRGNELRRNLSPQDRQQDLANFGRELARRDHPANQVLDHRLGDTGIDGVVAHLVAHTVSAPTQREL